MYAGGRTPLQRPEGVQRRGRGREGKEDVLRKGIGLGCSAGHAVAGFRLGSRGSASIGLKLDFIHIRAWFSMV